LTYPLLVGLVDRFLVLALGRERMERSRARGSGGFESCPVRSIGRTS
jgi:hypothetical protein